MDKTIIGAVMIEEEKAIMLINDKGDYIHLDLPNKASFKQVSKFIKDSIWIIKPNKKIKRFRKIVWVTDVDAELDNFYNLKKHLIRYNYKLQGGYK